MRELLTSTCPTQSVPRCFMTRPLVKSSDTAPLLQLDLKRMLWGWLAGISARLRWLAGKYLILDSIVCVFSFASNGTRAIGQFNT
eukprot:5229415-Amphidinium_carterae.1